MAPVGAVDEPLERYRRFFAEEIAAVARLQSPALVDALAAVPRERFLGAGPWQIMSAGGGLIAGPAGGFTGGAGLITTPDADPRRVYHNIAVAIDPARQLFNGEPSTLATYIDRLRLQPGDRLAHVGCGTGYDTALMAHMVTPSGQVTAIDVDDALADRARENLAMFPWIDVKHGDGTRDLPEGLDAIFVNAGVTHPLPAWLDALAPGGRLLLPLTTGLPGMGATIGKGVVFLLTKQRDAFDVALVSLVAIYSAVGIRDEALAKKVGIALSQTDWASVKRLRLDAHEPDGACWYHGEGFCFSRLRASV